MSKAICLALIGAVGLSACGEPGDFEEIAQVTGALTSTTMRGPNFIDSGVPYTDLGYMSGLFTVNFRYGETLVYLSGTSTDLASGLPASVASVNLSNTSLEWGDFNGDGRDEAVVGLTKMRAAGFATATGGIVILKFASSGSSITSRTYQVITAESTFQGGPNWGKTLAAGDFNGDGYDDLMVGSSTNYVMVYLGSASGLSFATGLQFGIGASTSAMVAGDFNCDGKEDVALGQTQYGTGGGVRLVKGVAGSPGVQSSQAWYLQQTSTQNEANDAFGGTLAAGNFNNDFVNGRPCIDLAVGIPGEDITGEVDAGAMWIFGGGSSFITTTGTAPAPSSSKQFHQNTSGVADTAATGDVFGEELVASDLNGDGYDDLAVLLYSEFTSESCGGLVAGTHIFPGSSTGLSTDGDFLINNGGGHNGKLGGAEKQKLVVTRAAYGPDCPQDYLGTYPFNTGSPISYDANNVTLLSVSSSMAPITRAHPAFVR